MAKLSKTMQKVMDQLNEAEHYYKIVGEEHNGITFHNEKGSLSIGFTPTWIYFDGMFGIRENTKTLEALEKRGLIKLHKAGGDLCDVVEVIGKEIHEPLTKAIKLKVTRQDKERQDWKAQEFFEYMDGSATTAEEIEKNYNENPYFEYKVEVIGEVELTRWDYRK